VCISNLGKKELSMAKAAPKKTAKPLSKSQVMANIAEIAGVNKKEVAKVLAAMSEEIKKNLGSKGPGVFVIPGLVKIEKKKVPARPAQKGVLNRLTGKIEDRPAKPASVKVKVRALKALKDMVPKP
jgi:nucleoid DNA-binding protein